GLVDDVTFHNPDGSVGRQTRIYDAGGCILEERAWSGDEAATRTTYSYDEAGRLVGMDSIAPDGTRHTVRTCQYDDSGRQTKITHLPTSDRDRPVSYSIEGTEYARGVPDAATLTVI